jgi:hypothetical protein
MKLAERIGVLAVGVAAVALGACENSTKDRVSSPPSNLVHPRQAIGGGPRLVRQISGTDAMSILADVRCDQEVKCGRVGLAQKHTTRDQCVVALSHDKSNDFTERSCPNGVSESAVADCVNAIREEGCNTRSMKRENACLAEKFCSSEVPGAASGPSAPVFGRW